MLPMSDPIRPPASSSTAVEAEPVQQFEHAICDRPLVPRRAGNGSQLAEEVDDAGRSGGHAGDPSGGVRP